VQLFENPTRGWKIYKADTKYSHRMFNLELWPWHWTGLGQTYALHIDSTYLTFVQLCKNPTRGKTYTADTKNIVWLYYVSTQYLFNPWSRSRWYLKLSCPLFIFWTSSRLKSVWLRPLTQFNNSDYHFNKLTPNPVLQRMVYLSLPVIALVYAPSIFLNEFFPSSEIWGRHDCLRFPKAPN